MMDSYYLSFCDTARQPGDQFLGACIVEAPTFAAAFDRAAALGCHPDADEVITKRRFDADVPGRWRDRLLSSGDVAEMDRELLA